MIELIAVVAFWHIIAALAERGCLPIAIDAETLADGNLDIGGIQGVGSGLGQHDVKFRIKPLPPQQKIAKRLGNYPT